MSIRAQGMRAWLLQRLSSIYIALFLVFILSFFWQVQGLDHEIWRHFIGHPLMAIATALFFLLTLIHAWVGIRDVLVDYVHPTVLRFSILVLLALYLLTMGIWVMMILLSVVRV